MSAKEKAINCIKTQLQEVPNNELANVKFNLKMLEDISELNRLFQDLVSWKQLTFDASDFVPTGIESEDRIRWCVHQKFKWWEKGTEKLLKDLF